MIKIGITGNIGSGKTTLLIFLMPIKKQKNILKNTPYYKKN